MAVTLRRVRNNESNNYFLLGYKKLYADIIRCAEHDLQQCDKLLKGRHWKARLNDNIASDVVKRDACRFAWSTGRVQISAVNTCLLESIRTRDRHFLLHFCFCHYDLSGWIQNQPLNTNGASFFKVFLTWIFWWISLNQRINNSMCRYMSNI